MKLYIKHIFAASAIGLYLSACSDFLDEKGYNTDYGYYKTSEGVEALVASCYQNELICTRSVVMVVQTLPSIPQR